jgi:6-phosphogluconolactonase
MMNTVSDLDRKILEERAAEIISESISRLLRTQEKVVLGLCGGRSVKGIFRNLLNQEILWKDVHIFMVDDRLVPISSFHSNFRLANNTFIKRLVKKGDLPEGNVHPFILDKNSPDYGISDYEETLKQLGGKYDIVLLSSGEDGHIGAIYPNHHSSLEDSEYYIYMEDSPKKPPKRMTMSRRMVERSQIALILFLGCSKKEAYEKFKDPSINFQECPAKLIGAVPDSYVITDNELL